MLGLRDAPVFLSGGQVRLFPENGFEPEDLQRGGLFDDVTQRAKVAAA